MKPTMSMMKTAGPSPESAKPKVEAAVGAARRDRQEAGEQLPLPQRGQRPLSPAAIG